jgi:hypothetical protein
MRIATYNVEWFSNLFDDDGNLMDDNRWSGRRDVKRHEQIAALGVVFTAMDADAVMIIEAPDSHKRRDGGAALQNFAKTFELRTTQAVQGFINETQQEISLLYDPQALTVRHDPKGDPRFDAEYEIDLDVDANLDRVRWSKPPLELAVETTKGTAFRMIGVHAKSKAPHGARRKDEVMRIGIANRRKQLAQCIWLRERVEDHLDAGDPLVVLGDFNDGPGLDEYERLFGRSGVEIVIGGDDETQLYDPHAEYLLHRRLGGVSPTTARFWIKDRWMQALLDYVMVSPDLREKAGRWCIWHPYDEPVCVKMPELQNALLTASDHFPVSVDLDI